MVCFQTKNPNLGQFCRALDWETLIYFMAIWKILWRVGIFCDHLVHFVFILYLFSRFGYNVPIKIWQPCTRATDIFLHSLRKKRYFWVALYVWGTVREIESDFFAENVQNYLTWTNVTQHVQIDWEKWVKFDKTHFKRYHFWTWTQISSQFSKSLPLGGNFNWKNGPQRQPQYW
jgi:hypothetical protein